LTLIVQIVQMAYVYILNKDNIKYLRFSLDKHIEFFCNLVSVHVSVSKETAVSIFMTCRFLQNITLLLTRKQKSENILCVSRARVLYFVPIFLSAMGYQEIKKSILIYIFK